MSASWLVGGLSPDALESYAALTIALARLADSDRITPCQGPRAALWTSDDADDLQAAAHHCTTCPVLDACRAHADNERHNTWGGVDRSPRTTRRKSA